MKRLIKIIVATMFILFDIAKLPFVITFIAPIQFIFCYIHGVYGDKYWFENWKGYIIEFASLTYSLREELFY